MSNALARVRNWFLPRREQSFASSWFKKIVLVLLAWPVYHLFWISLIYAAMDWAYFNLYGEKDL